MRIVQPERAQYFKDYWLKNKDVMYEQKLEYSKRRRKELLSFLGGKCKKCGFIDRRALQIDHKTGEGSKEIKSMGSAKYSFYLYKMMKLQPDQFLRKYQLLCANCNCIKGKSK